MANPQLTDYIAQQSKAGIAKDTIKSTLLGAGWADADVNEAFASLGTTAPAVSATGASPSAAMPGTSGSAAVGAKSPTITMDVFQPKSKSFFEPSKEPARAKDVANLATTFEEHPAKSSRGVFVGLIVAIVVALGAGAFGAMQYLKANDLSTKAAAGDSQSQNLVGQVATLSGTVGTLTSENTKLKAANDDLSIALSFFVASSTPPASSTVSVTGTVNTLRFPFTLLTNRQILLSIKNSADQKLAALLKPLTGTVVTVSGTRTEGTREITVATVNGTPLVTPAAATSTTSTTTQK